MASASSSTVFVLTLLGIAARLCAVASGNTLPPSPGPQANPKFNLIFFGDSLTDPGNDFKAAGVPSSRLYFNGRFCNGPNWADQLRTALSKKSTVQAKNYAYGGATACANAEYEEAFPFVKNLTGQVAAFAADVANRKLRLPADSKTLALQYIGAEDFLLYLRNAIVSNSSITSSGLEALVANVINCRVQATAALAAVPGITDIAILPLSPIHTSPAVPASMKDQLRALEVVVANQTALAMAALNTRLAAAGSPAKVHVIGNTTWITNGISRVNPPFAYLDEPCFWHPGSILNLTDSIGVRVCRSQINYLYYDQVHPNTRFHEWFAKKGLLPRLQALGLLP